MQQASGSQSVPCISAVRIFTLHGVDTDWYTKERLPMFIYFPQLDEKGGWHFSSRPVGRQRLARSAAWNGDEMSISDTFSRLSLFSRALTYKQQQRASPRPQNRRRTVRLSRREMLV